MPLHRSDGPSGAPEGQDPIKGRSFAGAERFNLEDLDPNSIEFAKEVVSLCLLIHARRLVVMGDKSRKLVEALDLFEWSTDYPAHIKTHPFPYFPSDRSRHEDIQRLEADYVKVKRSEDKGYAVDQRLSSAYSSHPNTPLSHHIVLLNIDRDIEEKIYELRRRSARGISVPGGRMRPTDHGHDVIRIIHGKPVETGAQILRVLMRAEEVAGKETRRPLVAHIETLWEDGLDVHPNKALRLQAFNRHLRKLGVALLEGEFSFIPVDLQARNSQVLAESFVDVYLSETRTKAQIARHALAYNWLHQMGGGQHGAVPFPSWQPQAKKECFDEAYKIVLRARNHSYHSFNRLRMENRSLGGQLPLFREFAMDAFEEVRFVRCDNIDIPPGRVTVMSGARLEKLFFGAEDRRGLSLYSNNPSLWFGDQLHGFGDMTVVALRQWIGLTTTSDEFQVMKDRYYYVIDNDHFSGSYGFAFGFPVSVVNTKLLQASYTLDEGPEAALDASAVRLSIQDLIEATNREGKLYLTLGHMSPLFGGMCNALPIGSEPVFTWERGQATVWRDVYDHVHWPWLVWEYRENRKMVEEAVRPLAAADWEIRNFAIAGQKLFEAFKHRYGAWKNDQTPGERSDPRLLARAYDIFQEHRAKGAAGEKDETIYIGITDRTSPTFNPLPVLNCHTLEVLTKNLSYKVPLPKNSDGSGKSERAAWRKHIAPMIEFSTRDGEIHEGPYELVIIGENDIKKDKA